MPHQATVTAQTGPAKQNTAIVLNDVVGIDFQLNDRRLFVQVGPGVGDNIKEYDLTGVTTVTCVIAGGNYTFTVS